MSVNFIRTRLQSVAYGFFIPLDALRLILSKKRLIIWSILPIGLTLVLSIWGVTWVKDKVLAWGIHELSALGYEPHTLTVQAAMLFLQIVLFVLAAISFSFLAGLVASPFNDFLAESAEPFTKPPLSPPVGSALRLSGRLRIILIDMIKTTVITVVQLSLLLIGLIAFWLPGLNLIPFAAAFWLLAFQFVSYPQSRRAEGVALSLKFLLQHPFSTFGFGAAIGFLFAIPVVSSLALPLAVVGGTLLYARAKGNDSAFPLKLSLSLVSDTEMRNGLFFGIALFFYVMILPIHADASEDTQPERSEMPAVCAAGANYISDNTNVDGRWKKSEIEKRDGLELATYFLNGLNRYDPFIVYNTTHVKTSEWVTRTIIARAWLDYNQPTGAANARAEDLINADQSLADIETKLAEFAEFPDRAKIHTRYDIEIMASPKSGFEKHEAQLEIFCKKFSLIPQCTTTSRSLLEYSRPYEVNNYDVTGFLGLLEFMTDRKYVSGLSEFGRTVAKRMRMEFQGQATSPSNLYADLHSAFSRSGMNKESATSATMLALQTYASRGASFPMMKLPAFENPVVLSMNLLMSAASYFDRVQLSRGQPSYFLPEGVMIDCAYGKPYHYWMAAALAYFSVESGYPAMTAELVTYTFALGYEIISTGNNRSFKKLLSLPHFSAPANLARMDLFFKLAGAHHGTLIAKRGLRKAQLDRDLYRQFRQTGKTPKWLLNKLRDQLQGVPDGALVVDWGNLVSPYASIFSIRWNLL
jgi:uncharacterized protein involved in cysteine biosynthesis